MTNRHSSRDRGTHDLRHIAHEAMLSRGMLPEFSPPVMREVAAIDGAAASNATRNDPAIRDLRALPWCSIDNDDSRDLDQLTVAEQLSNGDIRVLIAIADVDALVKKDTAVDAHAGTNTTSVYTAARIFPMLPEKLSTDLTSLNPGVDRLAVIAEYVVREDCTIIDGDVYRAAVHNYAKLAYNAIAAWLEGDAPPPPAMRVDRLDAQTPPQAPDDGVLHRQIRLQDQAAQRLRCFRHREGALQLETIEARPVFDGDRLIDLQPDRKNRARELIEDFMVAANGVTARYLERHGYASIRRVLRTPKRWDRIVALAAELGAKLPLEPDSAALDAFLEGQKHSDPVHFPDVSLAVVKLLGSGEYTLELPGRDDEGHFGLAVRDYNHSTAPNRRYPDLVTQRLLKAAMQKAPSSYTNEELATLAAHCTEQEDNANKVERQVRKSAAALLLSRRIGDRFDAIVTGASEKGTWVRIAHPVVEGRVVRGTDGPDPLDVGDRTRVELVDVNVERGYIDFARVDHDGRRGIRGWREVRK